MSPTAPARGAAQPSRPLVSIVIDNFNYAAFLPRAVESALRQTYADVEVIVVDDASTDGSQEVIRGFGPTVFPVLRAVNGGHAAALNSGFSAARGDIVLFLDADDHLYPHAAGTVVDAWRPGVAKVQFRLDLVDDGGRVLDLFPAPEIAFDSGDVVPLLLSTGRYETSVTSGNAFARDVLAAIMPIPEDRFRQGGDGYLVTLAPLYGQVVSIDDPLGAYVQHGANHSAAAELGARLRWRIEHDASRHEALRSKAAALGLTVRPDPGMRDARHLEARIASLVLDPARHPVAGDSRLALAMRGARVVLEARLPLRRRFVLAGWFLSAALLPVAMARPVVAWRIGGRAFRPVIVDAVLRSARRVTR